MAASLQLRAVAPPSLSDPLAFLRAVAASSECDYCLLHSSSGGSSLLGFDPLVTLNVPPDARMPLALLQEAVETHPFESPHPLIGWLGFLSYDIGRALESIPVHTPDELHWPLIRFSLFRHYLLFSPESGVQAFSLSADGAPTTTALPELQIPTHALQIPPATLISQQARGEFEAKIRSVKEYIAAGDIYQANLAQRWLLQTTARPEELFCRLCEISPAPYAACMRFRDADSLRHVVSASPELFLSLDADRRLMTRPIKGTRPRHLSNELRDTALRQELLESAKDQAELTMIVDLLRNDLGRVSEYGSVHVTDPRAIEQHPTVWHTVATVESLLRSGIGLAELLAAVCPGGSITGAPKIRAMQIIEELEGFRRALYCGNIGAIAPGGTSLLLNIAIRTILFEGQRAHVYAGGGVVADSDPVHEYEETLHKAAALFRALNVSLP